MKSLFHGHEKASGLYQILNALNGRVYIGTGSVLRNRLSDHLRLLRAGGHFNGPLQGDFNLYGEGAFVFEVVALIADPVERLKAEEAAISLAFGPGCYNLTIVCPPYCLGLKHSEESRQRQSKRLIGHTTSDETRSKIRAALTGRETPIEIRLKMSLKRKGVPIPNARGKKRSQETKARMSESALRSWGGIPEEERLQRTQGMRRARKGATNSEEHRAKISTGKKGKSPGPQSPEWVAKRVASRRATIESKKALSSPSST
jgi:group I intron endonuclease